MAELKWGEVTERKYETGVDHGVLYPSSGPGVAWSGLVSVNENVAGGDADALYYDGNKFHDFIANEDFQATITALSAPSEFAPCDGLKILALGLYATNQTRVRFGFTYRTRIGSYLDGTEHGYKIHLVYNATASPSGRKSTTLGDNPDVTALQWTIDCVPPRTSDFRPTAHIVFDSTKVDKVKMEALETILYGTSTRQAYLPEAPEALDILGYYITEPITDTF